MDETELLVRVLPYIWAYIELYKNKNPQIHIYPHPNQSNRYYIKI